MSLNDEGSNECEECGMYNCASMYCAACVEEKMTALRAENERLRELCHKSLYTLLSAGDALNWPNDIEDAIAELRKTLGR